MPDIMHIPFGADGRFTALWYRAAEPRRRLVLLLGHGAGAPQQSPFMVTFAGGLAERGFDIVTFNFPYIEAGRRLPDPPDQLERAFLAVVEHVMTTEPLASSGLLLGGKSLGGRMASHLAASAGSWSTNLRGLVFLGYPLHPPGQRTRLRTAHLARIHVPMLFLQGSRDAFGTPTELHAALHGLGEQATILPVEGGDHSFTVLKRWPKAQAAVYAAAMDAVGRWAETIASPSAVG